MKLLIQHTHSQDEIAGVLTYIDAIQPELEANGLEVQVISTKQGGILNWLKPVQWADIVHMNSNHLVFALLCRSLGKKIFIKYHYLFYLSIHSHYEPMDFWQRLKNELIYTLPKSNYPLKWKLHTVVKWARLSTRLGTAFLANYHTACSHFLAESQSFLQPVSVLYNPISVTQEATKKLEDLRQPYTFVFVGRLDKDKGVDLVLQATQQLREITPSFQVLIIGDGPQREELKTLAATLDLSDIVKFLGKLSRDELLAIVRTSLALLAPSRWQEPAGYVALEAASMQTCAIVSRMGGLPEMAGPHALLIDNEDVKALADHMRCCLEYPEAAVERGIKSSRYLAENFTPAGVASQIIDICQRLKPSPAAVKQ